LNTCGLFTHVPRSTPQLRGAGRSTYVSFLTVRVYSEALQTDLGFGLIETGVSMSGFPLNSNTTFHLV